MQFLLNIARGAIIGIAEIIPGVSGGTLAVIMGIYDKLIHAIGHLRRELKKRLLFLLPIVLGAGASILLFSRVIKYLLDDYTMQIHFLFLGLIVGIVPMLLRRATAGRFKAVHLLPSLIAFGLMIGLAVYSFSTESAVVVTALTPWVFLKFLIVGALAAMCLILPGISGSMMMVILGVYDSVITAVSDFNFPLLLPVGIGVILGILFGAKLIDLCLRRFPQATYFAILGLVLGSLISVYNQSGFDLFSASGAVSIVTFLAGVAASLYFTSKKVLDKTA